MGRDKQQSSGAAGTAARQGRAATSQGGGLREGRLGTCGLIQTSLNAVIEIPVLSISHFHKDLRASKYANWLIQQST